MITMSISEDIRDRLFELRDEKFAAFQANLTPSLRLDDFIGVRTPVLRKLAKEIAQRSDTGEFLTDLPHRYFDENQLHALIISLEKDFSVCIAETEAFLPCIDNWATCDQLLPKIFAKHRDELMPHIVKWLSSEQTYTVRFGIGMLMRHFLGENFDTKYADMVADVHSDEYYINMMRAWYFATALAKNYDEVLPYITQHRLDKWTNNKSIQKSVESFRITNEQKKFLRTYKI